MLRLAVRVAREHAEVVLAELLELAPSGVEEVAHGDVIEYAVYGPPGELPSLPDLHAAAGDALVEVSSTEVADDWAERWRAFHRPLVLGDRLTVRPPWEPRGSTALDIVIDPGQAFGTGAHATTRLCLELLLELEPRGALLDLGCGSGVLAIAAARLGWQPVLAADNDLAAVDATGLNAGANRAEVAVRRADLRAGEVPTAPTVTANLLAPLLLAWADRLAELPAGQRPGCVIAGGLLAAEGDRVAAAFARLGLVEAARRVSADWAALLLVAPHGETQITSPARSRGELPL